MSRFNAIVISAAVLVLSWQLMAPPVVGLGNNGDFGKLLGRFSLGAPGEDEYVFADTRYEFDSRYYYQSGFHSAELLLIVPAVALNRLVSKDGRFDLRLVGFIHGGLFLLATILFLPLLNGLPAWGRYVVALASLLVFGDVAYVSYLNSFYMDVAAYLFLLLATILFLRVLRWRRRTDRALLVVSSALLIASKPQHAVLGFWIAFLFLWQGGLLSSKGRAASAAVAAALAVLAAAYLRYGAPPDYAARGCFNTVFLQVLPHAKDPNQTMADLGLDGSYSKWIGKTAYSNDTQLDGAEFARAFSRRVSYQRLAGFFLTHPRDAYVALHDSLSEAGRHRPVLGNFDSGSGMKPWAESRAFALWSDWKRDCFNHKGTRFLTCFVLLTAVFSALLMAQRRSLPSGAVAAGAVLVGMAATELVVSSLADTIDIPRHHLLFYTDFDLLLLLVLYLAIRAMQGST